MKKYFYLIGLVVLFSDPLGVAALAQNSHREFGGHSMHRARKCATLEQLALSADQRDAIKQIETQQKGQILAYQQDLMIKRIELRDLLRDGQLSESFIKQKSEELELAQHLLYSEMMSYQIDIRRVLTPKQLKSWCTLIGGTNYHGGW